MKRNAYITCLFLAIFPGMILPVTPVAAQRYRSITGIATENYFDGTYALRLEEVFIAPVIPGRMQIQGALRHESDNITGSHRSLTAAQTGPILLFGPHLYGSLLYSPGIRDTGDFVHDGDIRLTYEQARYLLTAGTRARWEPAEESSYVVPSLGARVIFARRLGVQATYFMGYNSDREFSQAIWSEVDYRVAPRVTIKLGGTVDLGDRSPGDGPDRDYTVISGVRLELRETMALRYEFDYIGRTSRDDGIGNRLFLDWRF